MSDSTRRPPNDEKWTGGKPARTKTAIDNGDSDESIGDIHECDHLALIYDNEDERYEAVASFVQDGLQRDELVLYVVEEGSERAVKNGLSARGIDVEQAIDDRRLAFLTPQETYLRHPPFDPDEMIDFYRNTIEAGEKRVRVTAEAAWLSDDETPEETFVQYESKVNELFSEIDSIALCQYDKKDFSPAIIRDVIRTHPHLICDGTICQNVYFTPVEEFLGRDQAAKEIDRMIETLVDRSVAKNALEEHNHYLHELADIVSSPDRSFDEKLQQLFRLGCDRFDASIGAMAQVDSEGDRFTVEHVSDDHPHFEPGLTLPLSETFCHASTHAEGVGRVVDPVDRGYADIYVCREFGLEAYLGMHINVDGGPDRTFFFVSEEPRTNDYTDAEITFQRLMGKWVKSALEREHREGRLSALNRLSRELMDARSAEAIAEAIVSVTMETLDSEGTVVAFYDEETGALEPTKSLGTTASVFEDRSWFSIPDSPGWRAFIEDTLRQVRDPLDDQDTIVSELAFWPIVDHGVVVTGTKNATGFHRNDLEFIETVARYAEVALSRLSREQQLHERERTLETQNRTLERLDRINGIIRSIDHALVSSSSREEIETVVCEQLAVAGPFEFAWIGEMDPRLERLEPGEWAGSSKGALERMILPVGDDPDGSDPVSQVIATGEPYVVNDILADCRFEQWRQDALNRGFHAMIALPLVYEEAMYGVLNVYAGRSGVFADLERSVLAELADNVAYAINAVESKRALVSTKTTEVELTVPDDSHGMVSAARASDCNLELENIVPKDGGGYRVFVSITSASQRGLDGFVDTIDDAQTIHVSTDHQNGEHRRLVETDLKDRGVLATVLEHGGFPRAFEVNDSSGRIVIEIGDENDVCEFTRTFQRRFPDSELVAQRSRERPQKTAVEGYATLVKELTPRQLEVLQTAYLSGYFDEPRRRNSTEVASQLGISQPTLTGHLRSAQRKLCAMLFDRDRS